MVSMMPQRELPISVLLWGSGTDIAMESADMVAVKPNLMDVVKALKISQATITTIKEEPLWAAYLQYLVLPVANRFVLHPGGPS